MFRSLVVPGFGQLYSGRKLSGFGFMLLEAGLIGMVAKSNSDYTSFRVSTIRSLQTTRQQLFQMRLPATRCLLTRQGWT